MNKHVKSQISLVANTLYKTLYFSKKSTPTVTVFTYHEVKPEGFNEKLYPFRVSTKEFIKQIDFIKSRYTIISMQEFRRRMNTQVGFSENLAMITFDDGLKSVYQHAWPILKEREIPFTVFVCTGLLEQKQLPTFYSRAATLYSQDVNIHLKELGLSLSLKTEKEKISASNVVTQKLKNLASHQLEKALNEIKQIPMTVTWDELLKSTHVDHILQWNEIEEMHASGITIGSHGHRHFLLNEKNSKDDVRFELTKSKEIIEKRLNTECFALAYPGGGGSDVSSNATQSALQSKYEFAFTTNFGEINMTSDKMFLPRISLQNNWEVFRFLVESRPWRTLELYRNVLSKLRT